MSPMRSMIGCSARPFVYAVDRGRFGLGLVPHAHCLNRRVAIVGPDGQVRGRSQFGGACSSGALYSHAYTWQ